VVPKGLAKIVSREGVGLLDFAGGDLPPELPPQETRVRAAQTKNVEALSLLKILLIATYLYGFGGWCVTDVNC